MKSLEMFFDNLEPEGPRRIVLRGWSGKIIMSDRSKVSLIPSVLKESLNVPGIALLYNREDKVIHVVCSYTNILEDVLGVKDNQCDKVCFCYGQDIESVHACCYLFNKIMWMIQHANQYNLLNQEDIGVNVSTDAAIQHAMADFAYNMCIILQQVGIDALYKNFSPQIKETPSMAQINQLKADSLPPGTHSLIGTKLFLKEKDADAKAEIVAEDENSVKIKILAGSKISSKGCPAYENTPNAYSRGKKLITELEKDGILVNNTFMEDYKLGTGAVSDAANLMVKASANGWYHWKDAKGNLLVEIKKRNKIRSRKSKSNDQNKIQD